MSRHLNTLGRITALLVLGSAALVAQGTQTGSMTIDVVDASGALVSGVTIRLTSDKLQGVRVGTTNADGRFIARLLPPGNYDIQLVKDGFQTTKVAQAIGIDQNYQPRITLQKTAEAVVIVTAAASPAVDKSDLKSATNYKMDQIDRLPNGRTMEAVAFLTPGVTGGVGGRVQIRGAMTSANLYLVDGQNVADNAYNNRGVTLIDDAVEETQIITGAYSAEYGNVEGGVLNAITKSGSNTFSGMLRWDLTNPSWNAYSPKLARFSTTGVATLDNKLSEFKTVTLGGFIIPDRLWFFAAYYKTDSNGFGTISGNAQPAFPLGSDGAGVAFSTSLKEIRRNFKLTGAITSDHTIVAAFGNQQNLQGNRNYSGGSLASLDDQKNTSEYWNVDLRSVWSPSFTTDIRYGEKKQLLSAGPNSGNGLSPIYNDVDGLFYQNGIFNSQDGGDQRNNKSFNAKASYFFDGAGQHQLDFGLDYLKGLATARNEQSVNNIIYEVASLSLVNKTGEGSAIWTFQSAVGTATNESIGFYVNDKWQLNPHTALQLGVRWDKYTAKKENGNTSASASGISPRLGIKYDLFGDSKWLFGASAARYNGKVLDAIANSVTNQGNPTEIDYAYTGPGGQQPWSVISNPANYDYTGNGIVYFNDPSLNVKLTSGMKSPHVDEFQVSAAYSFTSPIIGDGFVSLTGVNKKWSDLLDYSIGNNGTVTDAAGQSHFVKVWNNSPVAERKYQGLELQAQASKGAWFAQGNISWSSLKGNYEGEGTNQPGRGEGLQAFDNVNGVQLFDRNVTAAYGALAGDAPITMRWTGSFTSNNALGKTVIGLVYRFNSGAHYSDTRVITRAQLNPAIPSEFGNSTNQYRDNTRGAYVFPSFSVLDLAITHDFPLFKVSNTPVNGFFKLVMTNFLNHQQILAWNTTSKSAIGTYLTNAVGSAWQRGATYGTSTAPNYGAARAITLSAGVRF